MLEYKLPDESKIGKRDLRKILSSLDYQVVS